MNYEPTRTSLNETTTAPRHSVLVRITHWLVVLGVGGLIFSGVGILISHPRLYWGETGAVGAPSLIDLPIPFIIGPSVWQRPIHFLFAWLLVFAGLTYVVAGLITQHFRKDLLPAKAEMTWKRIAGTISDHMRWKRTAADEAWTYNVVQRMTYLAVIFVLFPAIVWTGLAMSPALMSVLPWMVTVFGGHQSARTLHFFGFVAITAFVVGHVAMVVLTGFGRHMRAMIVGR